MELSGWIFMFLSVGFVVVLAVVCYVRVLTMPAGAGNS